MRQREVVLHSHSHSPLNAHQLLGQARLLLQSSDSFLLSVDLLAEEGHSGTVGAEKGLALKVSATCAVGSMTHHLCELIALGAGVRALGDYCS